MKFTENTSYGLVEHFPQIGPQNGNPIVNGSITKIVTLRLKTIATFF